MNQKNLWYRWLFYSLGGILFLILQGLVLNRVRLWGVHPFLPPVLVAVAAAHEDRQESLCAAAVFGLLCDLTMQPPIPCFFVLTYVAAAFLAGLISTRWMQPGFFCALVASLAALLIGDGFHALILSVRGVNDLHAAAAITGRELALTLPLTPLVYLLFRRIHRRFPAD